MEKLINIKNAFFIALGLVGGVLADALGGKTPILIAFLAIMASDYATGVIVAIVFKNSPKTETGAAQSKAGFIGLLKKVYILIIIMVINQVDIVLGANGFIRNSVIIGFIANELLSIVENTGLMGINLPPAFINAVDILKKKSENKNQGA